jgi:hypothetical protein
VRALACLPACRRRPAALPWAVGAQRMGHIVVASATQLCLRTLNGRTLAEAAVAAGAPPAVTAMAQTTGACARPPSEKRRETARNGAGLGAHAAPPRPRTDPISGVPVLLCAEGTAVVARALGDGGPPPPRPLLAELARCGRASSLPAMRLRWPYARGRRGWPAGQPASQPALEVSASARTCAWRVRGGCSCRVECGGAVAALAAAGGGAAAEQRHGGALVALAGGAVHGLQLS